jgi:hypothetical protein
LIKILRYGKSDVQEVNESMPYGLDSNPIADMIAVYSETSELGEKVIVGYLNKKQLAQPGEMRIYSTSTSGALKTFIWLKADGTMQLGGIVDNSVRYRPLNAGLQAEATAINAELTKIAAALNAIIPGIYVVAPVTVDISASKIDEIKTL